ncbi:hypothetical protein EG329_011451 [Mollisiaceae sp. DMI_Dod_QoI]|nr:hypothetical protein EG329_011451 [Helotiales sp. DMI_Dod_QoI]
MPFIIRFSIEQNYATHLLNFARNGTVFIDVLVHHQLRVTPLVLLYCFLFRLLEFPTVTGLPMTFGYVFAFGFAISWIGFLYALCGVVVGRLHFPENRDHPWELFYYEVYAVNHPLAPTVEEYQITWQWAQIVRLMTELGVFLQVSVFIPFISVQAWRLWKWWAFSTDLWIESMLPALL